jgi:hypothetical protein
MHKSRESSWKDQIITEDPSQESEAIKTVKRQPNWKKEVKADILEVIEKQKVSCVEDLTSELDHLQPVIDGCLNELKEEDVLIEKSKGVNQ